MGSPPGQGIGSAADKNNPFALDGDRFGTGTGAILGQGFGIDNEEISIGCHKRVGFL
jgi:hypothetical protein